MSAHLLLDEVHLRDAHATLSRDRRLVSDRAHAAIVGGQAISIEQAPWQVVIEALIPEEGLALRCGGAILKETKILTAAHCLVNPTTGGHIPAEDIFVLAGSSNFLKHEATRQVAAVSRTRIHPYYEHASGRIDADDVAVVELEGQIHYTPTAQALVLAPPEAFTPEGTAVNLTGFGAEHPEEKASGELNTIGMTTAYSRECGGEADALFVCAGASSGSVCNGDSGSALTSPALSGAEIGVADFVLTTGPPCPVGSLAGFANVAAPEIREFIEGSETPHRAPRGGHAVIRGILTVGDSLSCEPGVWSNDPTFTYTFVNSATGAVLQTGASSSYLLSRADIGQSILCEVHAGNAGGVGIGRTPGLGPIHPNAAEEAETKREEEVAAKKRQEEEAAKKRREEEAARGGVLGITEGAPDASLAGASLRVSSSGTVSMRINCPADVAACTGTVALRTLNAVVAHAARHKAVVLELGSGPFSLPGGAAKTVTVRLTAKALALLTRVHVLRVRVAIDAHDPGGGTHLGQTVVTLRAPTAKHRKR